jgi:hypothetical protein
MKIEGSWTKPAALESFGIRKLLALFIFSIKLSG